MIPDAEQSGATWTSKGNGRIISVGRLLRKTRLDKLQQLWNLFTGGMTLIGPRPERPEFVSGLKRLTPYYSERHSIKPGLTGWAQVKFSYGNSYEDSIRKLEYDLYSVKYRGPALDLSIVLRTVRTVLSMSGT